MLCIGLAVAIPAYAQTELFRLEGVDEGSSFGRSACFLGDVNGDGRDDIVIGDSFESQAGGFGPGAGGVYVFSGATGAVLYTLDGDSANDRFGTSVGGVGDIDGDGFDDLIVGAPYDDNTGADSGSARVISGATGAALYTLDGDSAGDRFGTSVSGVGDLDGDGIDDLIVGAPLDDNGGFASGSVRVISGATGAVLYTLDGDSGSDRFGTSVGGVGDVDGDGFDDLIVGAPYDDNTGADSGSARIFSGATGAVLYTLDGDSANDRFGTSVGGVGDIDGDGFDDLIVGAPYDDNTGADSGSARIFSGATGTVLYTLYGDSGGDGFASSVGGAGDLDGDGFGDLVIGAPYDGSTGFASGSTRVISGATGAALYTLYGDLGGDLFGVVVAGRGDINADGLFDLVIGSYQAHVRVVRGIDGASLRTFVRPTSSHGFGPWIAGAGDVNGDGTPDVLCGSTNDNFSDGDVGTAQVLSGADGSCLLTVLLETSDDSGFTAPVCGVGDLDSDGFDDFLAGSPMNNDNGVSSGVARVYSGASGAALYTVSGSTSQDRMGLAVGFSGDVNGDGWGDFMVASRYGPLGAASGGVRVFSGMNGILLHSFDGGGAVGFGDSLSGAGDMNGDGYADIVIGASGAGVLEAGQARVYSGLDAQPLYVFSGDAGSDWLGSSVSDVGDLNADGFGDILVGAPGGDHPGPDAGYVRAFSGFDGSVLFSLHGDEAGDEFGSAVSGVGDMDGDGYPDFVVGAPRTGQPSPGYVRAFSGQYGLPLYTVYGFTSGDSFGAGVSGVGDLDGDGLADVIIGSLAGGLGSVHAFSGAPHPFAAYCFGDSGGGPGTPCPCLNSGFGGEGCMNSSGAGATLGGVGLAFLSNDTVSLVVDGAPGSKPGLVLRGQHAVNGGVGLPAGGGLLCVTGQTARSQVQATAIDGTLTFTDFKGQAFGASSLGLGQPTRYQFWYRDTTGPCGSFNFSNGLSVSWLP